MTLFTGHDWSGIRTTINDAFCVLKSSPVGLALSATYAGTSIQTHASRVLCDLFFTPILIPAIGR